MVDSIKSKIVELWRRATTQLPFDDYLRLNLANLPNTSTSVMILFVSCFRIQFAEATKTPKLAMLPSIASQTGIVVSWTSFSLRSTTPKLIAFSNMCCVLVFIYELRPSTTPHYVRPKENNSLWNWIVNWNTCVLTIDTQRPLIHAICGGLGSEAGLWRFGSMSMKKQRVL